MLLCAQSLSLGFSVLCTESQLLLQLRNFLGSCQACYMSTTARLVADACLIVLQPQDPLSNLRQAHDCMLMGKAVALHCKLMRHVKDRQTPLPA